MALSVLFIKLPFEIAHIPRRNRQERAGKFSNVEDDQVPTGLCLTQSSVQVFAWEVSTGHLTNIWICIENFFNLKNRDAVLLLQLFNELVFPNDFANDHEKRSYHHSLHKNIIGIVCARRARYYVIVIGNGRKHSANTINVTIPIAMRSAPSGSICSGCGWRTRSMIRSNTMKRNQAGLPCH